MFETLVPGRKNIFEKNHGGSQTHKFSLYYQRFAAMRLLPAVNRGIGDVFSGTMRRKLFLSSLLLLLVFAGIQAAPGKPSREVFGLRLGMSEEAVHKRMRRIATQQREEREEEEGGEQEVWILKKDSRYNYLITKFSREHRLLFVTVVAHPSRVRYSDLGETKDATVDTDGMNYSYKWKIPAQGKERAELLIARGGNAEFLTSFSLYLSR
jgi:hypothetical protein